MTDDLIRYDVLTQEALRGVIRKVLDEVIAAGLPGDHHFFITFDTTFSGVRLSKRMRERYPESMTIVIQHSYWDLKTSDTDFEVDLTFNDIRERLKIPFAAIQAFFDPSVKFGLQFEPDPQQQNEGALEGEENEVAEVMETLADIKDPKAKKSGKNTKDDKDNDDQGEVVSLDAFRKKK